MKLHKSIAILGIATVLPLTREWIEISLFATGGQPGEVLPLTREWIEILTALSALLPPLGSPSYEGVD